jgi:hypothetical protein
MNREIMRLILTNDMKRNNVCTKMAQKMRQETCLETSISAKLSEEPSLLQINNDMMRLNKMKYQLPVEKSRVSETKRHEYQNQRSKPY